MPITLDTDVIGPVGTRHNGGHGCGSNGCGHAGRRVDPDRCFGGIGMLSHTLTGYVQSSGHTTARIVGSTAPHPGRERASLDVRTHPLGSVIDVFRGQTVSTVVDLEGLLGGGDSREDALRQGFVVPAVVGSHE